MRRYARAEVEASRAAATPTGAYGGRVDEGEEDSASAMRAVEKAREAAGTPRCRRVPARMPRRVRRAEYMWSKRRMW